jgi:hypothetical protein
MKTASVVALAVALLLLGAPAVRAAPVSRPVELSFQLELVGLGSFYVYTPSGGIDFFYGPEIQIQTAASIAVDDAAGTMSLAPGAIVLGEPVDYLVNGTTAFSEVRVEELTNLTGTFAVGGAGGHAGEPPCPLGSSGACVAQTGFGGTMALLGTYFASVVPTVIVFPVPLSAFGQPGTLSIASGQLVADGAPWTVGTARITEPATTYDSGFSTARQGSVGSQSFRLVTPTFVTALGNRLPFFASLTVEFTDGLGVPGFVSATVPEPAAGLLWLGAAALGLAVTRLGRRR